MQIFLFRTFFHFCVKTSFFIVLLCAILNCGGSSNSDPTSNGCSLLSSAKIVNGEACSNPTSPVLRVTASGVGICTGTVISENIILTAAHCVVRNQNLGVIINGTNVAASRAEYHPLYTFSSTTQRFFNDAALLFFDAPLQLPTVPFLTGSTPVAGDSAYIFGYGDRAENTLQSATVELLEITPNHLFTLFDGSNANSCNGDSGGPLMILQNGTLRLAGVISQGNSPTCAVGDLTSYTNLQNPEVQSWIESFL